MKTLLVTFIFFFSFSLIAQTNTGLQSRFLNSFNGLSSDHVRQILEDEDGMMWFATSKGLNRYDGKNILRYKTNPEDEQSIPHNDVRSMLFSQCGELWIGTQAGLAKKLNNNKFVRINNETLGEKVFPSNNIIRLLQAKNGNIWVATQKGLVVFKANLKDHHTYHKSKDNPSFPSGDMADIFEDKMGNIWFTTWGGGISLAIADDQNDLHSYKITNLTNKDLDLPENITFNQIIQDENSNIWLQEMFGVFYRLNNRSVDLQLGLNRENLKMERFSFNKFDKNANDITAGAYLDGVGLFACTNKSNYIIPPNLLQASPTDSFDDMTEIDGLTMGLDIKEDIYLDSRNIVWIASNKGVFMYFGLVNRLFEQLPAYASIIEKTRVSAIYHNTAGIWLGTDQGLFIDNQKELLEVADGQKPIKYVTSFEKAENEDLWIGNINGLLFQLREHKNGFKVVEHPVPALEKYTGNNHIWNILEVEKGTFWLATHAGVFIYDSFSRKTTKLDGKVFKETDGKFNCFDIVKGPNDRIYVSATGFGLYVGTPNESGFYDFELKKEGPAASEISSNIVFDLEVDDEKIWIAQSTGVEVYDIAKDSFYRMPTIDKAINSQVFSIVSVQDELWITTPSGLTSYSKKENTILNFSVMDGLIKNHSMLGHFKGTNGNVYLGGMGGYHLIDKKKKYNKDTSKELVLSHLSIGNQPVIKDEKDAKLGAPILTKKLNETASITLSHAHDNVEINFSVQDFISPHQYEYSYVLKGISDDWVSLGQEQKIKFTHLPNQDFELGIKAMDQFGNWSAPRFISIKVLTPFWKKTSNLFLISLLAFAVVVLGMKYQEKEIQRRNLLLEEAVEERTLKLKEQNERLASYIESNMKLENFAHATSHDLKAPMNNISSFATLLKRKLKGRLNEEENYFFSEIEKGTNRLNNLIDDILTFSKLNSENLKLTKYSISKIIDEVLNSLSTIIEDKTAIINFKSTFQSDLVTIDKIKISRVIQNLLTNAMKFIPKGSCPEILIWMDEDEKNNYVHVKDNGIGISNENQLEVFKMFKRVGHTANYEGTGFGLTISKKIMELHEGDLRVLQK